MQRQKEKISRKTRVVWCCSGGFGLTLVVVFFVFLRAPASSSDPPSNSTSSNPVLEQNVSETVVLYEMQEVAAKMGPTLPPVDYPLGSMEDVCGLNEFPPWNDFWHVEESISWANSPKDAEGNFIALESEECRDALEAHINSLNPYLWMQDQIAIQFAFVKLENPLTFERIFADPEGDLTRVQDALSRPECLLERGTVNWELKETCHADAILNYALINRFCFNNGTADRELRDYWEDEHFHPTPEQDRFMWKQDLEDEWVRMKCKGLQELNSTLSLALYQPELYELILSLHPDGRRFSSTDKMSNAILIELAARLGDDAAGLTREFVDSGYPADFQYENGFEFGRFFELLNSDTWKKFTVKREPSAERFEEILYLLAVLDAWRPDPREEIEFDWEFVARHLCEPPYFDRAWITGVKPVKNVVHLSCREVVHELRQKDIKFAPLLQVLDKFEQVAIELEVYE